MRRVAISAMKQMMRSITPHRDFVLHTAVRYKEPLSLPIPASNL
jgi:hypothetical protein